MGNLFVYASRKPTYENCKEDPTLIFVPQEITKSSYGSMVCSETYVQPIKIPCRFIPCQSRKSPYIMVFFHGNSEDIGISLSEVLLRFVERFDMNIICPEYPSYGIYNKKDDSLTMEEAIFSDARRVIKYCKTHLKFNYENIILVGRSLGTGVVVRMAAEFKVMGSILISPFTAIRDVAKLLVGSILAKFAPDVFRNIDYIDKAKSPVLIIHGKEDALIPYHMAVELYDKAPKKKMLKINEGMDHNQYKVETDLFTPIHTFMENELDLKSYLSVKFKKLKECYDIRSDMGDSETNLGPSELGF